MRLDPVKADKFFRNAIAAGANPEMVRNYLSEINNLASAAQTRRANQSLINKRIQDAMFRPAEHELDVAGHELDVAGHQLDLSKEQRARESADVLNRGRQQDYDITQRDEVQRRNIETLNTAYVDGVSSTAERMIAEEQLKNPNLTSDDIARIQGMAEREFVSSDAGRRLLGDMRSMPSELYETTVPGQQEKAARDIEEYRRKREGTGSSNKAKKIKPRMYSFTEDRLYDEKETAQARKATRTKANLLEFLKRRKEVRDLEDEELNEIANIFRDALGKSAILSPSDLGALLTQVITSSRFPGMSSSLDAEALRDLVDVRVALAQDFEEQEYQELIDEQR
jgi:hypothetical protein